MGRVKRIKINKDLDINLSWNYDANSLLNLYFNFWDKHCLTPFSIDLLWFSLKIENWSDLPF